MDFVHSYTVNPDPCGSAFSATASIRDPAVRPSPKPCPGRVTGNNVTFTGAYYQPNTNLPTGYTFTFTGHFTNPQGDIAGTVTDSDGRSLAATGVQTGSVSTSFKNHGEYVNSVPASEKAAAAQSCVGTPSKATSNERRIVTVVQAETWTTVRLRTPRRADHRHVDVLPRCRARRHQHRALAQRARAASGRDRGGSTGMTDQDTLDYREAMVEWAVLTDDEVRSIRRIVQFFLVLWRRRDRRRDRGLGRRHRSNLNRRHVASARYSTRRTLAALYGE